MTRPAHNHDDILTPQERAASAKKCLDLLQPVRDNITNVKSAQFVREQLLFRKNIRYAPSMSQLNWLRDLVAKYAA